MMPPYINGEDHEDDEVKTLEDVLVAMLESLESIDAKLDVIMGQLSRR
jgi:hypothetical protein